MCSTCTPGFLKVIIQLFSLFLYYLHHNLINSFWLAAVTFCEYLHQILDHSCNKTKSVTLFISSAKTHLSQRNHFVWTPGGLSLGEESCTLFHNSCNEKCYHKLISWFGSNCLLFVQITGSFLQWDNIGGHE